MVLKILHEFYALYNCPYEWHAQHYKQWRSVVYAGISAPATEIRNLSRAVYR